MSDGYSVLVSLSTKEEADVVVGALRASGIPAIIGNANAASVDWTMVQALGGLQVMVPTAALGAARDALDAHEADAADGEPPLRRTDRWKAGLLLLWIVGPVAVLAAIAAGTALLGQFAP